MSFSMEITELINRAESTSRKPCSLNNLKRILAQVHLVIRFITSIAQPKDNPKMLRNLMKAQEKAHDLEIFKKAQLSLKEKDDIAAIELYLLRLYQTFIPKRYDEVFFQAIREEVSWFLHPLFLEALNKYPGNPDKVIQIFQDSSRTLNLLWKSEFYNQMHEKDSQFFLSWDRINASEEMKKVAIGKAGWCPLMRVKTTVYGTLMTDFMITCVKFWTYRKVLQNHN